MSDKISLKKLEELLYNYINEEENSWYDILKIKENGLELTTLALKTVIHEGLLHAKKLTEASHSVAKLKGRDIINKEDVAQATQIMSNGLNFYMQPNNE